MPNIQIGGRQRISEQLLITASMGLQPFSTNEFVGKEDDGISILEPVFDGFGNNVELLPTFSLLPSFHHMSRPKLDLQAGIGLGYLFSYRTEKLFFNDKIQSDRTGTLHIHVKVSLWLSKKFLTTRFNGFRYNFEAFPPSAFYPAITT